MEQTKTKMILTGELFKKSFAVYKGRFWRLVGLMLSPVIFVIPVLILFFIASFFIQGGTTAAAISNVVLGFLGILVLMVAAFIAQIAMFIMIHRNDPNLKVFAALKIAKGYFWRFFLLGILVSILVSLWSLLFIIPGIIMSVYYTFSTWVLIDENLTGMKAIRRSKELIKKYWWAVAGRSAALSVLAMLVFFVPSLVLTILYPSAMTDPNSNLSDVYSSIMQFISWLLTPFFVAYAYNMYKSLKKIKGGSNVEMKTPEISQQPPMPPNQPPVQ